MSTWLTWLSTTPENENATAGQHGGDRRQSQRPQEEIHADGDEGEEDHLGGYPRHTIREDGEEPDQWIERAGVEAGEKRCAAEDVLVPKGQFAMAVHGPDQHMEWVVLLQVVARHQQVTVPRHPEG